MQLLLPADPEVQWVEIRDEESTFVLPAIGDHAVSEQTLGQHAEPSGNAAAVLRSVSTLCDQKKRREKKVSRQPRLNLLDSCLLGGEELLVRNLPYQATHLGAAAAPCQTARRQSDGTYCRPVVDRFLARVRLYHRHECAHTKHMLQMKNRCARNYISTQCYLSYHIF